MASNLAIKISVGGYDLNWLEDPPDDLKCLICLCVARDPHQHPGDDINECGKVFCHACITKYRKKKTTCPNCRCRLTLFKDSRSARDIKALKVKCSNLVNGCCWVGELGSLDAHLQSCDYALLPCTNECKIDTDTDNEIPKFLRKDLEDHLTNDCPRRQYKCPHCQETGEHEEWTTTHILETCPKVEVSCSNDECQVSVYRCELSTHYSVCDFKYVACKYKEFGCEIEHFRKYLKEHEEDDKLHLSLTKEKVLELNKKVICLEKKQLHTFKLSNYQKLKGDGDTFFSPPFYAPSKGYKMFIRVIAANSFESTNHVSLFVYLMKGDNDDYLAWPFPGTITIELLNQLEDDNHHITTTTFPADSKASQRVVYGEKGSGWGWRKFISHADLDYNADKNTQYLKDDTLVFRVSAQVPDHKPWLECTL